MMVLLLFISAGIAASIRDVHASQTCSIDTCAVSTEGPALIQKRTSVSRSSLETAATCAPFQAWPNVDNGKTCSPCTALVLTGPYGGRCDRYCESFGHTCTGAAEEKDESCTVLQSKACDEEIKDTSDMLCTCQKDDSSSPAPAPSSPGACFNTFPAVAVDEGEGIGEVDTGSVVVCQDACAGNDRCQSFAFSHHWGCFLKSKSYTGTEPTQINGDFKTHYKVACATTTLVPTPIEDCYGELPGLAVDEGQGIDDIYTKSAKACQEGCSDTERCKSISFSPSWGCFLKTKAFSGGESARRKGDFVTYYKMPCAQTTPPSSLTSSTLAPTTAPATTLAPTTSAPGTTIIKVVSYNIYWWNAFGQNPWKGNHITDNIKNTLQPDVLGLQECDDQYHIQRKTGYLPASPFKGAQGVMVNPSLFTVGDSGSRDIEATGKWGPRYVTWAQMSHKASGLTFWAFNTHWCVHNGYGRTCGPEKRYEGAQNMLRVIQEKAGSAPVIITGDFNAGMGEQGMQHFLQNGFSLAANNWVDAVFYSTTHWQKVWSGKGSSAHSDHSPVIAELRLM